MTTKKPKYEYEWRDGMPSRGLEADRAYKELKAIEQVAGTLNADVIIRKAKNPKHYLHTWFEWDDSKAAAQHRKTEANNLQGGIMIVQVKYEPPKEKKPVRIKLRETRALINVATTVVNNDTGEEIKIREYKSAEEILQDPLGRAAVLGKFFKEMRRLRTRYAEFTELSTIFEKAEAMEKKLAG